MWYQGRAKIFLWLKYLQKHCFVLYIHPPPISGPALLLPPQRLSLDHKRTTRRDTETSHLHGVSKLLPLDRRSNWRWLQFLIWFISSPALLTHHVSLCATINYHQCLKIRLPKCTRNRNKSPSLHIQSNLWNFTDEIKILFSRSGQAMQQHHNNNYFPHSSDAPGPSLLAMLHSSIYQIRS